MAKRTRYSTQTRDSGGFLALPFAVIDSAAYRGLSAHARALLIEIARQLRGDNNGMLLCSRAYMATRGWNSNDTREKCLKELVAAKLVHQTVMGCRPNRASWYAVTWLGLDKLDGYDHDLAKTFERSAYRDPPPAQPVRKTPSLSRQAGQAMHV
jgi:hypothetical protein